ncbi:hypothetical protein ASF80_00830 [Microbacterium sp. Leaf159]|nr:hypothetical protein ASF80_00830 [Microbacterium sp. Leaf159]
MMMTAYARIVASGTQTMSLSARSCAFSFFVKVPLRVRCSMVAKNVGIVTAHVTMHQGHSTPRFGA